MGWREKLREAARLLEEAIRETAERELTGGGTLGGATAKGGVLVKKLPALVGRLKSVLAGAAGRGTLVAPPRAPVPVVSCLVERDGDIIRDRADNVIVLSARGFIVAKRLQERDGDLILDRLGNQISMRAA